MNHYKSVSRCLFLLVASVSFAGEAKTVNIGDATFSHKLLNVGAGESTILASDLNSDGHQDLIISNYSDNNIVVYRGDGKGGLIETSRHAAGENPTDLSVSDINSDGIVDVIIANHETSYITLLYGDGLGSFKKAPHSPLSTRVKPHPHVVQLRDLDGDNKLDLIIDNRTHHGLSVLKGLGNGKFKKTEQIVDVGGDPYLGFAVGDINGDGKLDLVTPNQRDIGIALNSSKDKLSYSLKKLAPIDSPFAVELADLTGDGKLDLIAASAGSLITIIPGDGQGNYVEKKKTTIKASAGAKQIAVGDINGDGIKDALISSWSGDLIVALGSKTRIEIVKFVDPSIPNPWNIVLSDLNEDGKSDLIIASGDSKLAALYLSHSE